MIHKKRLLGFVALFLCLVVLLTLPAGAAYYNTYSTIATLGNPNSCYSVQGFAAGSTYGYTINQRRRNPRQHLRTKLSDGQPR